MDFYHGSKLVIQYPIYKGSNFENDFGPSFYITTNLIAAKIWACKNDEIGVVSCFSIDDNKFKKLKILDLTKKDEKTLLTWLSILMHFRRIKDKFKNLYINRLKFLERYYVDVNKYDVIKGYRADDAYFSFPLRFLEGNLSLENLSKIYKLGDLGIQYSFVSRKAISLLEYKGKIECDYTFVGQYHEIVKEATKEFQEIVNKPLDPNETFIGDLEKNDKK